MTDYKNIDALLQGLLEGFNPKQQKVILRRFGLKSGECATLQEIGDELGVTRERIRQIEEDTLKKLEPRVTDAAGPVVSFASTHLDQSGGVRRDDFLVGDIASYIYPDTRAKHAHEKIRFFLTAAKTPLFERENDDYHAFWYSNDEARTKFFNFVKGVMDFLQSTPEKTGPRYANYLATCNNFAECHYLNIPKSFGVNVFGDFGLRSSPEIEPRTVRDKAYLVLRKHAKPLHFGDIAKYVTRYGIDSKPAHVQTVHNELIKDKRFVLVGRGIYGLREQGFEPGTVREVIARILKKKGPMQPHQVVKLVSEQRFLKENTILLGLQNKRHFRELHDGRFNVKEA
ncbi:MAG: sigma factor-like helix-turn-helix DNA-binding protein [Patescibacteria group bacterium]